MAALTRLALLPNVPTLHESGFPGFESSTAYGLLAPAGTPEPIINKLHGELVKIIKSPESVKRLEGVGAIPVANSPAEVRRGEPEGRGEVGQDHPREQHQGGLSRQAIFTPASSPSA